MVRSIVMALLAFGTGLLVGASTTVVAAGEYRYDAVSSSRVEHVRQGWPPESSDRVHQRHNIGVDQSSGGSSFAIDSQIATNSADDLVDLASPARRTHILDGEARPNGSYGGGHCGGTGFPGKSEFPTSLSDDRVMHHISDVATDPASQIVRAQGRDVFVRGARDGIEIEVLIRNGEIWTGYPTNVPRNP